MTISRVKYLNPLHHHAVEVHIRLVEVLDAIGSNTSRAKALGALKEPAEVQAKQPLWFSGEGCYLTSTAYLTASLFAWIDRVTRDYPFLRLTEAEDHKLSALILRVQRAFLDELGIYYVLQPSIGHDLWASHEPLLRTYREFCELLVAPATAAWLDRLFLYYIETARGEKLERVQAAVAATHDLASFLDRSVLGSGSIAGRLLAESDELNQAAARVRSPG